MYTCRRSGDPLSADIRRAGRQERTRVVRGSCPAAGVRHVLDTRRQRNHRLARRSHQRVLDARDG